MYSTRPSDRHRLPTTLPTLRRRTVLADGAHELEFDRRDGQTLVLVATVAEGTVTLAHPRPLDVAWRMATWRRALALLAALFPEAQRVALPNGREVPLSPPALRRLFPALYAEAAHHDTLEDFVEGLGALVGAGVHFMANREAGQLVGVVVRATPITDVVFESIRPLLRPGYVSGAAAYRARHPDMVAVIQDDMFSRARSVTTLTDELLAPIARGWALPAPVAGPLRFIADRDLTLDLATVHAEARTRRAR